MIARLWQRDTTLFAPASAPASVHAAIANRMRWLDLPATMPPRLHEIREVMAAVEADGLTHLVLLGMGGSSLCAETLRECAAFSPNAGRFTVLDTTDERTILNVVSAHDPAHTLFVVASKSGDTLEVTSLEAFFRAWIERAALPNPGRHFVAITDAETPLAAHAGRGGYRHVFLNPPDVGGRYSALSLFGLVPACWLGIDLDAILNGAVRMAQRCAVNDATNPGLELGAFMAGNAIGGRNTLTILLPLALQSLGVWIEQLVADSTGKNRTGILPIVDEPPASDVGEYRDDRAFVVVTTGNPGRDAQVLRHAEDIAAAGHPVLRVHATDGDLGAEFFRWEFATAVAAHGLGVNPFDEPDVLDAKARTKKVLDHFLEHAEWPAATDLRRESGVEIRRVARAESRPTPDPHYIALLDYLPTDRNRMGVVDRTRRRFRARTHVATTYGAGPRYLHSTGQYHKGGPNNGRFIVMTSVDETSTPVPGKGYSFSVLKHAQALGDIDALTAAGREVVHVHLMDPSPEPSMMIERLLSAVTVNEAE